MFLDAVKNLLKDAKDCGVKLALESFCWENPETFSSILSSPEQFVGFVRGIDSRNLGITLDIGHTFQNNVDICGLIRMCRSLLVNIHIHDSDGKRAHLSIGEGKIDFKSVIETLRFVGYSGALSLELVNAPMNAILFNKSEFGSFLKEPG